MVIRISVNAYLVFLMDDVQEPQQLSELEQNALNRKRRLRQFRSQLQEEEAPRPNDGQEDESVGLVIE